MTTINHLPYEFSKESKFSYYEMLWKHTTIKQLNAVIPLTQRSNVKVLDVGSGRGEMMKLLSSNGYQVEGMDFDSECVRLSSQYGLCRKGSIEELTKMYPANYFDSVILLHVLEHLYTPYQAIESLKHISKRYIQIATPNLSSFAFINWSRKVSSCNKGHVCGWNHAHLNNLLTNHCGLRVVNWSVDCVPLYNTLPYLSWLDRLLHKSGLRGMVEENLLKRLFPQLSFSLIALCEKAI